MTTSVTTFQWNDFHFSSLFRLSMKDGPREERESSRFRNSSERRDNKTGLTLVGSLLGNEGVKVVAATPRRVERFMVFHEFDKFVLFNELLWDAMHACAAAFDANEGDCIPYSAAKMLFVIIRRFRSCEMARANVLSG